MCTTWKPRTSTMFTRRIVRGRTVISKIYAAQYLTMKIWPREAKHTHPRGIISEITRCVYKTRNLILNNRAMNRGRVARIIKKRKRASAVTFSRRWKTRLFFKTRGISKNIYHQLYAVSFASRRNLEITVGVLIDDDSHAHALATLTTYACRKCVCLVSRSAPR